MLHATQDSAVLRGQVLTRAATLQAHLMLDWVEEGEVDESCDDHWWSPGMMLMNTRFELAV